MEIGAGRFSLFDRAEIELLDMEYITNDIDPAELERALGEIGKTSFDISTADVR
jgi:hypothetical protein